LACYVTLAFFLVACGPKSPQYPLTYRFHSSFQVGFSPRSLAHADLNGDGHEDLIVGNYALDGQEATLGIFVGKGDGTFSPGAPVSLDLGGRREWNRATAIEAADLSGDGRPDLVVMSNDGVSILKNTTPKVDAPPSFGAEQTLMGGNATALAVADLHGSKHPDIIMAAASRTTGLIKIASAPVFIDANHHRVRSNPLSIEVPGRPTSLAVADLNGDGEPDVIFSYRTKENEGGVAVLLNMTAGAQDLSFSDPQIIRSDHGYDFVGAADLDGNGKIDLVVGWRGHPESTSADIRGGALALMQSSDGTFEAKPISIHTRDPMQWALQDVNHDNKPDLVFLDAWGETVNVALGLGNGTFAPESSYSAVGMQPSRMAIADFKETGNKDIAVLSSGSAQIVHTRSGDQRTVAQDLGVNYHWYFYDRQKYSPQTRNLANSGIGSLNIFFGRKDGTFDGMQSVEAGWFPDDAVLVPHQGLPPKLILRCGESWLRTGERAVRTGERAVTQGTITVFDQFEPPFAHKIALSGAEEPAIAGGDLANDGAEEIVVVGREKLQIYALGLPSPAKEHTRLRQRDYGLHKPTEIRIPANLWSYWSPQRAALVDLNGSGKPDLVTGDGNVLWVFMNTTPTASHSFSFAAPLRVPMCAPGSMPMIIKTLPAVLSLDLAVGDINGDGKPDLIVNSYCGLNIIINQTPTNGTTPVFAPAKKVHESGKFVVADLHRTGRVEIAVLNNSYAAYIQSGSKEQQTSTVDILANDGSASLQFQVVQHITTGGLPSSIAVGDFNGDGWPDIAVANSGSDTLSFALNDGHGRLLDAWQVPTLPEPLQVLTINSYTGRVPYLLIRSKTNLSLVQ
jgi:hypothetical protein